MLEVVDTNCSDTRPFGGAASKPAHILELFQKQARQVIMCLPVLAGFQSGRDPGKVLIFWMKHTVHRTSGRRLGMALAEGNGLCFD